ncbi:SIS domain-containing protein [Gammaproteobacteria bacterium]|jgi:D-sedoheptulose 7-phosphate isomerase|nr:SIS domain-containing protein [Gammaproteobacteria bacterium]
MKNQIIDLINLSLETKKKLLKDDELILGIKDLAQKCLFSLRNGGKIIFAGNGGSFADSQHISAEFTSRFLFDRAPLASITLGTNNSAITAIGNDYGYDQVFARELKAIGKKEDIFIPITTSGNSENIISSIQIAKSMSIDTICLTGNDGGKIKNMCNCIVVPAKATERVQECHILIGHIICALVEEEYFKN